MEVNQNQKLKLFHKLNSYFGDLSGKTIALWGLAFKPYTDDIREAPSLYNIDELLKAGAEVKAYDPEAMDNIKRIYGDKVQLCDDEYDALKGADALLIVTEWPVFRQPDFNLMANNLNQKVIFDGRNLYPTQQMKDLGFKYFSIGREEIND